MSSVLVVTFAFLTECAPHAAAGAMALENMLRNPAAAIAAVITPPLVAKMGAGWFFSGFALFCILSVGIGSLCERQTLISPLLLRLADSFSVLSLYGPRWRASSPIAPIPASGPPPMPVVSQASTSSNHEKTVEP